MKQDKEKLYTREELKKAWKEGYDTAIQKMQRAERLVTALEEYFDDIYEFKKYE